MKLSKPITVEEAKEYACNYTSRFLTKEQMEARIRECEEALKKPLSEYLDNIHKQQIKDLNECLKNEEFISGNYHQSIDEILLELIEWRALFYAFQKVDTSTAPFNVHMFFQQWKVGGAYTMYSLLAKLVSRDSQDKSLRNLWCDIQPFIEEDINTKEIEDISKKMQKDSLRFSGSNSKAMAFRNKVIAHNEKSVNADLAHLDHEIKFLARVWSLITTWSSFGLMSSWRDNTKAFSGLEHFYSSKDLTNLKEKREEYLDQVHIWCKTNILTSAIDKRSPFMNFSVTVKASEAS